MTDIRADLFITEYLAIREELRIECRKHGSDCHECSYYVFCTSPNRPCVGLFFHSKSFIGLKKILLENNGYCSECKVKNSLPAYCRRIKGFFDFYYTHKQECLKEIDKILVLQLLTEEGL